MSSDNPSVNRSLDDSVMDHIDHALGRPTWPNRESYRNYFAVDRGGDLASAFAASPHWKRLGQREELVYFAVTDIGRNALAAHLKKIGDPHKAYSVTYGGYTSVVPAASPAKAKYARYLQISDVSPDLTLGAFVRKCSVRVAS